MTTSSLKNRRILVVEDEYLLADELQVELEMAGAIVLGPVAGLSETLAMISATEDIDAALLDGNLKGEMVFPAAERLQDRNIPIVFVSGYDAMVLPTRFKDTPRCEKPVAVRRILLSLVRALDSG